MKIKQLLTKTLLLAVCLLTGASNAWATDVPYSIGSDGCAYRAEYSDPYTVKNGETLHITFTNNNYGTSTVWNNYVIEATSAVDKHDVVYFDLRGDNYAFDAGTFVQNYNGNFLSDLNGATVDNYITYAGGVITVNQIFTKSEVTTYNRVYTYTVAGSPKSVIIYVTEEAAQVTITNVETSKWSTVWSTDFSSAPSGMSYSISKGACDIDNGYLRYYSNDGSGDRTTTASFTDAAFSVDTDWMMELDWNCGSANTNTSSATFATDQGTAFSMEWVKSGSVVTVKNASGAEITTTLPHEGYNKGTTTSFSHFKIKGVKDDGIYLTITKAGVVYVNNVKVSSTYGYPVSFNGVAAKNVGSIFLDNIYFQTPAVAGFVATPTSTITGASGTSRKFTLSCLTDGATIYYATSDLEKGAAGWNTYAGEVTTDATTIYAYAEDDDDNTSDKMNFATGAGTTVNLADAIVTHSNNGVYTIASDQSAVLGTPTATIHYQIDGGSEQTSTNASVNVNIDADGTLTYWLTAEGYGSTAPADETVYAAVGYAATTTLNFCTSSSNKWAYGNVQNYDMSTIIVATDNTDRTYYKYLDESSNVIGDGLLAVSAENEGSSWRIDQNYGGVHPYNKTEYVVLLGMEAGQLIQIAASSAPSSTSNLTAVPAATYTGTYTYTATADGEVIFSFAKNVVLKTIKLCKTTVPAAICTTSYTTFASSYPLNIGGMTASTGTVKAYYVTASDVKSSSVALTEVTGNVAAGTGLILEGTAGATITIPVVASGTDYTATNMLVGCTANTNITASTSNYENFYVLSATEAAFKKIKNWVDTPNTLTIPAGKAYLDTTNADVKGAPSLTFDLGGELTGIADVKGKMEEVRCDIFDLQGRKVAQPQKGLYIQNGRKVILK